MVNPGWALITEGCNKCIVKCNLFIPPPHHPIPSRSGHYRIMGEEGSESNPVVTLDSRQTATWLQQQPVPYWACAVMRGGKTRGVQTEWTGRVTLNPELSARKHRLSSPTPSHEQQGNAVIKCQCQLSPKSVKKEPNTELVTQAALGVNSEYQTECTSRRTQQHENSKADGGKKP